MADIIDYTRQIKNRPYITVTDFPYLAKGDGIADDTTAIQSALDAGDDVYLPEGTYLISASLKVHTNQHFHGANRNSTIILVPTGITGIIGAGLPISAVYNGTIENLTLSLLGNNSIGIDQKGISSFNIKGNYFLGTAGKTGQYGIKLHGGYQFSSYYTVIDSNLFQFIGGTCIDVTDAANHTVIINNRILDSPIGVSVDGGTKSVDGTTASSVNTCWISHNAFEANTTVAIQIGTSGIAGATAYDTSVEFNRSEQISSTHRIIGAGALTTRFIGNWYTGGSLLGTDAGSHTTYMEPRSFGGGVSSSYDMIWRQNVTQKSQDDVESYYILDAGNASAQLASIYFSDRGTQIWKLAKFASGDFYIMQIGDVIGRVAFILNGSTIINSKGATAIRLNSANGGVGTGGVEWGDGNAHAVGLLESTGRIRWKASSNYANEIIFDATPTGQRVVTFPDRTGNAAVSTAVGLSGTLTVKGSDGANHTITVDNGVITATTLP